MRCVESWGAWNCGREGRRTDPLSPLWPTLIIFCAFLLALPIPLLPFSNTLPALGLVFTAHGYLTRKPTGFALGVFFAVLSVAYFSLLYFVGREALQATLDYFSYSKEGSGS
jgi:hypothetical protein